MHRTISLGRCTIAVTLATILLTGPAAALAQLPLPPLPLPSPSPAISSVARRKRQRGTSIRSWNSRHSNDKRARRYRDTHKR